MVAVAGRRIDRFGANPARFPIENVPKVQRSVGEALQRMQATALVSSAANGADLIAADWAVRHGIPLQIVLPFPEQEFKRSSVTDRPGDWGSVFELVIAAAKAAGSLTVLAGSQDDSGYLAANATILEIAARGDASAKALIIWDGRSRGDSDVTAAFSNEARQRGMQVESVSTVT